MRIMSLPRCQGLRQTSCWQVSLRPRRCPCISVRADLSSSAPSQTQSIKTAPSDVQHRPSHAPAIAKSSAILEPGAASDYHHSPGHQLHEHSNFPGQAGFPHNVREALDGILAKFTPAGLSMEPTQGAWLSVLEDCPALKQAMADRFYDQDVTGAAGDISAVHAYSHRQTALALAPLPPHSALRSIPIPTNTFRHHLPQLLEIVFDVFNLPSHQVLGPPAPYRPPPFGKEIAYPVAAKGLTAEDIDWVLEMVGDSPAPPVVKMCSLYAVNILHLTPGTLAGALRKAAPVLMCFREWQREQLIAVEHYVTVFSPGRRHDAVDAVKALVEEGIVDRDLALEWATDADFGSSAREEIPREASVYIRTFMQPLVDWLRS